MIDTRYTDLRPLTGRKDLIQRQRHTVCRCTVHRPMPPVDLSDPKRPPECETVRSAALFRCRSNDVDLTELAKCLFERDYAVRVVTVVICDQDPGSVCHLSKLFKK